MIPTTLKFSRRICENSTPVKSSSLDPVPTFLLREYIDTILPFFDCYGEFVSVVTNVG